MESKTPMYVGKATCEVCGRTRRRVVQMRSGLWCEQCVEDMRRQCLAAKRLIAAARAQGDVVEQHEVDERKPVGKVSVEHDSEAKVVRIQFEIAPDADERRILRAHGFRIEAKREACWARAMTDGAVEAAHRVVRQLMI